MAKTTQERLQDTLAYLGEHADRGQAMAVATLLGKKSPAEQETISGVLSLKAPFEDTKGQRRAVRANVLLSQLFITTEFLRAISVTEIAMEKLKSATEEQLCSRLKSWWVSPALTEADVCKAALDAYPDMPDWGNNPCDPARIQGRIGAYLEPLNCFSGVMYWAYRGGAISLNWLWNEWFELEGRDADGCIRNAVMGLANARVWKQSDMVQGKYDIPAGHTVQFVNKIQGRGTPFGHVVLSLGGGRCLSQNRCDGFREADVEGGVPPADTQAVIRMRAGKTQNVAIRTLREGFYSEKEGYHTLHSAPPFWLHGLS